MRPIGITVGLALAFGGCSIVYDPGTHMSGGVDGGADANGSDAGLPTVDLAAFCTELVETGCTNAERCCMEGVTPRPAFNRAMCLSDQRALCTATYGLAATNPTKIGYDPVAAYEALEESRRLVEACDVGIQSFLIARDGFYGGITGTIGGGEDCTPSDETNETEVLVAALSCVGGQVCQPVAAGDWRCSAPGVDGATCASAFACASGRCEQEGLTRTCGAGEPAESPCFRSDECQSLTCAWRAMPLRLVCSPQTQDNVYCVYAMIGDSG